MKGLHEKYLNKEWNRVDVFYEDQKVYILFRKSRSIRKKFVDFVKKHSEWVKLGERPLESLSFFKYNQREIQA